MPWIVILATDDSLTDSSGRSLPGYCPQLRRFIIVLSIWLRDRKEGEANSLRLWLLRCSIVAYPHKRM